MTDQPIQEILCMDGSITAEAVPAPTPSFDRWWMVCHRCGSLDAAGLFLRDFRLNGWLSVKSAVPQERLLVSSNQLICLGA
jgi:hypothetical protein